MTRGTVLIVDDEELLRWSLGERLLQDGFTLIESGTAADAIAQIRLGGIDLVLLDWRLPDSDGVAVLRELKARSPEAGIILMTALPTLENAAAASEYGACDFLIKPFDLDDMAATVEKSRRWKRV